MASWIIGSGSGSLGGIMPRWRRMSFLFIIDVLCYSCFAFWWWWWWWWDVAMVGLSELVRTILCLRLDLLGPALWWFVWRCELKKLVYILLV